MTVNETIKILAVLEAAYHNKITAGNEKMTLQLWSACFSQDPYEDVQKAVLQFINTDTKGFAPVPGQIHEILNSIRQRRNAEAIEAAFAARLADFSYRILPESEQSACRFNIERSCY